jgi:phenylalanyl-tRNA synthetase alpha chain
MPGPDSQADLSQPSIDAMVAAALAAFAEAGDSAQLKEARLAHSGERSPLSLANRAIGSLPGTQRKEAGQRLGAGRGRVAEALAARETELGAAEMDARLASEKIDVTLPVEFGPEGAAHPITSLMELMSDVFISMGWHVAEGPEAEGEWLSFDALNIGPDHPARGTTDTLYVEPINHHIAMRPHTSPVQIRSMLTREPPIYIVCPGKVYRADEFDATHVPVFHQIEGLCIDKGISLAHLKGTLDHLAKAMFGEGIVTRMRPHYFPFTEPSAEVDLKCFVCHGASVGNPDAPCRTCKSQGWIEWGGCGVVNPRVLIACGIDPEVYSGFAFGMGIERTLMFRNNAADMRDMVEGDVRFSRSLKGLAR